MPISYSISDLGPTSKMVSNNFKNGKTFFLFSCPLRSKSSRNTPLQHSDDKTAK